MPKSKSENEIRVRFAPSPTGFLHMGSLRTALYNYLFAHQKKGVFILRIEDTDRTRYVKGALESLLKTLKIIGLKWDEGPYIQSERLEIYKKYAQELVEKGKAYYCFCSPERLEKMRKEQELKKLPTMYDGHCRNQKSKILNHKYVVRLAVPRDGETEFTDLIRGQVKFENKLIDDQVLIKSDGFPTYHLANVVDDHLMKISHVIRGEEWLSSTPKHILLYQAFGWTAPQFAHMSLLLNPDRSKLSKRQGDVAVEDYLKKGYLPEALLNFVALLGWSSAREPDREIFSLPELIKEFSLERISPSGAIFNLEKLDWLNGEYIKKMRPEDLVKRCLPYFEEKVQSAIWRTKLKKIITLEQGRMKKLSDMSNLAEFFFKKPDYPAQLLIWRKSDAATTLARLKTLLTFYDTYKGRWTKEGIENATLQLIQKENLDNGATLWPLRAALAGRENSPGPFEIAEILGHDETLKRLKLALSKIQNF